MQTAHITNAGQLSVPAAVRRRWGTRFVLIEDYGDHIVVRPAAADPVAAARGALKGRVALPTEEMRRLARADELQAEERRAKSYGRG